MNSIIKNIKLVTTSQWGTPISRFFNNKMAAQKFTITLNKKDNNHPRMIIKPFRS
jgi:hypothetical protein